MMDLTLKFRYFLQPCRRAVYGRWKKSFLIKNTWFANLFLDVHMCMWRMRILCENRLRKITFWKYDLENLEISWDFTLGKSLQPWILIFVMLQNVLFSSYRGPFLVPFSKKSAPFLLLLWDVLLPSGTRIVNTGGGGRVCYTSYTHP